MSLKITNITLPSAEFNGVASLPSIYSLDNVQHKTVSELDEYEGLFIKYGFTKYCFPYMMQDRYDRGTSLKTYKAIELENEYLKAVFLPEFGGRIWSLFDKEKGVDLLYKNSMVRPCNLALRNAWLSGGIEYNIGIISHSAYTCDTMYTAVTKLDDGTPVLRMYQYERIRNVIYQMDFFLPEKSKVLYARIRVTNPSLQITPMYWYTNIAVPEGEEYRNIMNADSAYTFGLINTEDKAIIKLNVPYDDKYVYARTYKTDVTYPTNINTAGDFFWIIPDNKRKYTSYLNKDGYGFFQASTSKLVGRKLFVWGQGEGSKKWQEYLTSDDRQDGYVEIQAGLTPTQYETRPMPPRTTYEWLECYGAVQGDAKKVHGEWADAVSEINARLDEIVTDDYLEKLLLDTRKMATSLADEVLIYAEPWGALEVMRREKFNEKIMCAHLDFGKVSSEQMPFVKLLNNGAFDDDCDLIPPKSWIYQPEWTKLIENAKPNYLKYLNLGAIYLVDENFDKAEDACNKALSYKETPTALFILAQVKINKNEIDEATKLLVKACKILPNDLTLARESLRFLIDSKKYSEALEIYNILNKEIQDDGRVTMYYCFAILHTGNVDKAWEILNANGGIVVSDIRECETSLTELYIDMIEAFNKRENKPTDRDLVDVPKKFDFRMFRPKKIK